MFAARAGEAFTKLVQPVWKLRPTLTTSSVSMLVHSVSVHRVDSTGRRNTSIARYCDAETETEKVRTSGSTFDAFTWSAAGSRA
jgi:hypothetical protein